jgi:hypothetical protein
MAYTHNPKKPKHCYHIATATGTACKMENTPYYRHQVKIDQPPRGKSLCEMCKTNLHQFDDKGKHPAYVNGFNMALAQMCEWANERDWTECSFISMEQMQEIIREEIDGFCEHNKIK